MRKAFITGITGQDGSYLAEFLLERGYEVHGIMRRSSSFNTARIDHIFDQLHLHYGDMSDVACLFSILHAVRPDEIYNLAAQSHVKVSFDQPVYTGDAVGLGTARLLEAIRSVVPTVRYYQAGSSEMFGKVVETPQKETTPFYPRSPYAAAKVYAHWLTVNYRESYGMHASNGILFNHESPRRGETFVTRKITRAAARIKYGLQSSLVLGNIESKRDWGYAKDYVEAMWLMLQQPHPDDYVIATGETHTVREWLTLVFQLVGLNHIEWTRFDKRYMRPAEVDLLLGDASKAAKVLEWKPSTTFRQLAELMVEADLKLAHAEAKANGRRGLQAPALVTA